MVITEKTVTLNDPFDYAHPSEGACKASFILLKAPTLRHAKYLAPLRQVFTRAAIQAQKVRKDLLEEEALEKQKSNDALSNQDEDSDDVDAEAIIAVLESSNENMEMFIDKFSAFVLTSKLFKIEGEIDFTEDLLYKMSIPDFYNLMGTYLSVFILAALSD